MPTPTAARRPRRSVIAPPAAVRQWPWPQSTRLQAVWLMGQPPLDRLLEELENCSAEGEASDYARWVAAWSRVNDRLMELERQEAGIANSGSHRPLDKAFAKWADAVTSHPIYRQTFRQLPTTLEMVELDKLIVYQLYVTRNFVDSNIRALGPRPAPRAIFDRCLPLSAPDVPVRVQMLDSQRFLFSSPSSDLRFHSAALLPAQVRSAHQSSGSIAAMLGLPVGFGCNFLNAIRVGNRYLLHNGYHRACALRASGVTHAPCVVETATREDEVQAATSTRVGDDPTFYFESARPPMLKDFFDPELCALIDLKPAVRHVEVRIDVREYTAVDCSEPGAPQT